LERIETDDCIVVSSRVIDERIITKSRAAASSRVLKQL